MDCPKPNPAPTLPRAILLDPPLGDVSFAENAIIALVRATLVFSTIGVRAIELQVLQSTQGAAIVHLQGNGE